MIYDCFSFFNELDLLEIRLNTLDKVVDRFILAESPLTHTGNPKPLYYAENKARFAKFNDRIIHIIVDDFPEMPDDMPIREKAWTRENWQRNAIVRGLPSDVKDDDILLISDLDEIPDPIIVRKVCENVNGITRLDLRSYSFYLNWRNFSHPIWRNGTKILTLKTFKSPKTYCCSEYSDYSLKSVNQGPTATRIRFIVPQNIVCPAGWHFTYIGGVNAIIAKLKSIAHTEFNSPSITDKALILQKLKKGTDLFGNGEQGLPEPINGNFPAYLQHNASKFTHLIFPTDTPPPRWKCIAIRTKAIVKDISFSIVNFFTPKCLVPLRHLIYTKLKGYNR